MNDQTTNAAAQESVAPGPTGPRTDPGKAASSRNALKHGLTASKVENTLDRENRATYEKLRRQYLDDFRPEGAIENTLLDMVILAAWQLYKIRQMETFTPIELGWPGQSGRSERLARYRGSNERLLFRSLNQLRAIQQERALLRADRLQTVPERLAPGVRVRPLWARVAESKKPKLMTAGAGVASVASARAYAMRRQNRQIALRQFPKAA